MHIAQGENFHVSDWMMMRGYKRTLSETRNLFFSSSLFSSIIGFCLGRFSRRGGTCRVRIFIFVFFFRVLCRCFHIFTQQPKWPQKSTIYQFAAKRGIQTSIEIEQSQWGWNATCAMGAFAQWQKARRPPGRQWVFFFFLSLSMASV